jgi:hypothetical protein
MQSNHQNSRAAERHTQTLELISAIAHGDAKVEDVAAQLRKEGFDALDVVLALVSRVSQAPRDRVRARRGIDFQHLSKPTPPELVRQTVHRVPKLPFVLNGTIYDPQDIRRFDGRELHFVAAAPGEPILAVDDREVMAKWWQLTYLSSKTSGLASLSPPAVSKDHSGPPRSQDFAGAPGPPPGGPGDRCVFYSDIWWEGDWLILPANFAWWDLTEVGRGVFHWGDWNDIISSLVQVGTVTVLCEDIHYQGSTFTVWPNEVVDLGVWGWNDRTSSMVSWDLY